jgi:uncharacterized protein YbjT (DUF2867 family)
MTQPAHPVLVTGATGNTGRAVVADLARRGVPVRAMVHAEADRDRLPADVAVAVADFDDPVSVAAALRGAERAYLVTPSSERAEAQQRRFADLAVQAGVGHLVVLSQLGSDEQSPVRFLRYHAAVERHIRDLGMVSPAVAEVTGRPATDVRQFAHDYARAFAALDQQPAG